jgi:hypothetical protein
LILADQGGDFTGILPHLAVFRRRGSASWGPPDITKNTYGLTNAGCHDLRHTFVTNARGANIDYFRLTAITRQKTLRVFQRYNLIDEVDLQEAMTSLQTYIAHQDMDTSLDTGPDDQSAARRKNLVNPRG